MVARAPAVVGVLNNSEEVVELLDHALRLEGYTCAVGTVLSFRRGEQQVAAFFATHEPDAVVWDIAVPYEENWEFFKRCLDDGLLDGRGIVLTTSNKRVLDELVGPTDAFELIGKPYDLDEIIGAVRRAIDRSRYAST